MALSNETDQQAGARQDREDITRRSKTGAVTQTFTFAEMDLLGELVSFSTQQRRRYVVHEFPKRKGGRVEDMDSSPMRIEVRLVFSGDGCALRYRDFARAVDKNPYGLLIHPTAGRWNAYCEGPLDEVDFARATNAITVRVAWIESELDGPINRDTPPLPTASQDVIVHQSDAQLAVASFMGALAKASLEEAKARDALDSVLAQVETVTAPVDFVRESIANLVSAQSAIMGTISSIRMRATLLNQDIQTLIDATSDGITGGDIAAGASNSVDTMVAAVQRSADDLKAKMIESSSTPAQAADAVGAIEEAQASTQDLADAMAASRPPLVEYVVPELIDLITLAQQRYGSNALARANEILGLNRIQNPAAIRSGTVLRIPSE